MGNIETRKPHFAAGDKLNNWRLASGEFEDKVAQMLRVLGFESHRRVSVKIADRVHYRINLVCLSSECTDAEDGFSKTRSVWVKTILKSSQGVVRKDVLLELWGVFACMLYKERDHGSGPDSIWLVTNGKFSRGSHNLAQTLNEGIGRELFVLIDGTKLDKLTARLEPPNWASIMG